MERNGMGVQGQIGELEKTRSGWGMDGGPDTAMEQTR